MKIYMAGYFNTRQRLYPWRDRIIATGHEVSSSWLHEPREVPDHEYDSNKVLTVEEQEVVAVRDLDEIDQSDLVIVDTFDVTPRGGREVEIGYAMALGIPFWIVGPPRNVFHHLAERSFRHWGEVLNALHPANLKT